MLRFIERADAYQRDIARAWGVEPEVDLVNQRVAEIRAHRIAYWAEQEALALATSGGSR